MAFIYRFPQGVSPFPQDFPSTPSRPLSTPVTTDSDVYWWSGRPAVQPPWIEYLCQGILCHLCGGKSCSWVLRMRLRSRAGCKTVLSLGFEGKVGFQLALRDGGKVCAWAQDIRGVQAVAVVYCGVVCTAGQHQPWLQSRSTWWRLFSAAPPVLTCSLGGGYFTLPLCSIVLALPSHASAACGLLKTVCSGHHQPWQTNRFKGLKWRQVQAPTQSGGASYRRCLGRCTFQVYIFTTRQASTIVAQITPSLIPAAEWWCRTDKPCSNTERP